MLDLQTWADVVRRDACFLSAVVNTDEKRLVLEKNQFEAVLAALERFAVAERRYGSDNAHVSAPEAVRVWETAWALRIASDPSVMPPWQEWAQALACLVRHECADAAGRNTDEYVRKVNIDSIIEHHGLPGTPIEEAAVAKMLAAGHAHEYDLFLADLWEFMSMRRGQRERARAGLEPYPMSKVEAVEEPVSDDQRPIMIGDKFQRHNQMGPHRPVLLVTDIMRAWPGTEAEEMLVTLRQAHWDSPRAQIKEKDLRADYRRVE